MARIRTIKPEFWMDEDLATVSESTLLLAIGLLNHADDEGWFRANELLIKAAIFPLREPSMNIPGMLQELSNIGYICIYIAQDGKRYGKITNFLNHQKINKPTASKIKDLGPFQEYSGSPTVGLPVGKEQGKERKGKERNIMSGNSDESPDPPPLKKNVQKTFTSEAKIVLEFLNEIFNKNFQPVEANLKRIAARLQEANKQFQDPESACLLARRICIDRKSRWGTDDKMAEYLRPATLFAKENFWNYAGQLPEGLQVNSPTQQDFDHG